jgi:hypothetical protein
MTTKTNTPRDIDTKLAALYGERYAASERAATSADTIKRMAGAEFFYRGRRRITRMSLETALSIVEPIIAANADDTYGYSRPFPAPGLSLGQGRKVIERYREAVATIAELTAAIVALDAQYTGWSRFFLVTSSAGHIHSSMSCHTCRPTTTYGWLPELSGKDADTAVAELGPTLCTACFPDAPVAWTAGKKLTAAQASKRAA